MRALAVLFLVLGMGAVGFEEAKKLTAHTRHITVLFMDAMRIEKEMEWEAPKAATLFRRLKSPVFQCAAERMEAGDTPEEAIAYAARLLPGEEREALSDYAAMLFLQSPSAQVRGAEILAERLKQMELAAREKEKRLAMVYRLTGLLGGLLLSLLLL